MVVSSSVSQYSNSFSRSLRLVEGDLEDEETEDDDEEDEDDSNFLFNKTLLLFTEQLNFLINFIGLINGSDMRKRRRSGVDAKIGRVCSK